MTPFVSLQGVIFFLRKTWNQIQCNFRSSVFIGPIYHFTVDFKIYPDYALLGPCLTRGRSWMSHESQSACVRDSVPDPWHLVRIRILGSV
jgi:hypothetical protein